MREFAALDGPPDDEILAAYVRTRVLPDGRVAGVKRLLFHWTMHVDITEMGISEHYCYETADLAIASMESWDGVGDPEHWHKHPKTRRRRDPRTGEIWDERDDAKRLFERSRQDSSNDQPNLKGMGR